MALAYDLTSTGLFADGGGGTSLTFSHTCTGSELLLIVGVAVISGSASDVTSVTYNGVAMTAIPSWNQVSGGGSCRSKGYYLIAPATGAHNVVITVSPAVNIIAAGATSFTGADQTTPLGTANTATADNATATVDIASATGEIVIDCVATLRSTITVGASQTSRWEQENIFSTFSGGGSTEPGATTVTMSWTLGASGDSDSWAIGGVSVKPSAGGGATARIVGTGLTESRLLQRTRLVRGWSRHADHSRPFVARRSGLVVPDNRLALPGKLAA